MPSPTDSYSSALPGARRCLPKPRRRGGLPRGGGSFYGRVRGCAAQDHQAHDAVIDASGGSHRRTGPDLPRRNGHRWRAAVPASRLVHLSDCARLARRPGFLGASHGRDDPRSFTLRKSKEFSGSVPVHERAQYQHLESSQLPPPHAKALGRQRLNAFGFLPGCNAALLSF